MTDPVAALARIQELALLLNGDMDEGLAAFGLTPARAHLVGELRRLGPSTQRVLSDVIEVSPRNITGLVDGLVATGFVTREAHPTDRRATLVTLTSQGTAVTERLQLENDRFAQQLFADMPPRRLDALHAGLGDVIATIQALREAASRG